jgi:hypothetical protein
MFGEPIGAHLLLAFLSLLFEGAASSNSGRRTASGEATAAKRMPCQEEFWPLLLQMQCHQVVGLCNQVFWVFACSCLQLVAQSTIANCMVRGNLAADLFGFRLRSCSSGCRNSDQQHCFSTTCVLFCC